MEKKSRFTDLVFLVPLLLAFGMAMIILFPVLIMTLYILQSGVSTLAIVIIGCSMLSLLNLFAYHTMKDRIDDPAERKKLTAMILLLPFAGALMALFRKPATA